LPPDADDPPESPPADVDGLDPLSVVVLPGLAVSSFVDVLDRDVAERSFLAQPEPLKWNVGGANAFVMVPSAPHSGQNFGP
jgi:hypothetical protein